MRKEAGCQWYHSIIRGNFQLTGTGPILREDPEPDPHVFGPPGFGSGSISQEVRIRILPFSNSEPDPFDLNTESGDQDPHHNFKDSHHVACKFPGFFH